MKKKFNFELMEKQARKAIKKAEQKRKQRKTLYPVGFEYKKGM